ncbi:MAG: hypothetical protein N2999_08210 [Proteobacteria bacterium]|nr:hypothetical protein [Pseudomonadota bacterium]
MKDIEKKILEVAKDRKLPCKVAFKLAEELNISLKEIGDMANKLNIKITNCQLGCFK